MRNLTKHQTREAQEIVPEIKSALLLMDDEWRDYAGQLASRIEEPAAGAFLFGLAMGFFAQNCDEDLIAEFNKKAATLVRHMAEHSDRVVSMFGRLEQRDLSSPDAYFTARAWEDAQERV